VGLPDERTIRQATKRAKQTVVYTYGGRKAGQWWEENRTALERSKNLTIINLSPESTRALAALAQRDLDLHCTIQDGQMWMGVGEGEERVEIGMGTLLEGKR